jgi:hypothetical protein
MTLPVGRDDFLASDHTPDAQTAHQPFDRAACDILAFTSQDMPDLPRAVELAVALPGSIDLDA